jgi:hypothetical protein
MRINNIKDIDSKLLWNCYSTNLYKYFVQSGLEPVGYGIHRKTKKRYGIFVKTTILTTLLDNWDDAKTRGVKLIE